MFDLTGKAALVTGGTRGLGREIALVLAEMGADVVVNYHADHRSADDTVAAVSALGRRAVAVAADLEDEEAVRGLVRSAVAELGRLDIVVANAVSTSRKQLLDVTTRSFWRTMRMNVGHLLVAVQEARPYLGDGGRVIAITGACSTRHVPDNEVLGCAKAAMEAMVRQLAFELGPQGVTVNGVGLGLIDTASSRLLLGDTFADIEATTVSRSALGRVSTGREVATVVGMLCSPEAGYVTGEIVTADGGVNRAYPLAR